MRLIIALSFMLSCFSIAHADILVVANPDVTLSSMQHEELADIFLKRHASIGSGQGAVPVNRPANSEVRQQFEAKIMDGMSSRDIKKYWLEMRFKGVRPPLVQDSDEAIILFVKRVSGAIAYLRGNNVPDGVKLLARIEH